MSRIARVIQLLTALLLAGSGSAVAVTIQFEGVAPVNGEQQFAPTYTESGFDFTHASLFRVLSDTFPGLTISNGTDQGFVQSPPSFTITASSGGTFSLQQLDAGEAFGSAPGTLTVTGNLAGGGILVETFSTLTNTFLTYTFPPDWTNLTSVNFVTTSNFFSIDNVIVSECPSGGLVSNGNFESGDLCGWQQSNTNPTGYFYAYTGASAPLTGNPVALPPEGAFAATSDQNNRVRNILYQDVDVPASGTFQLEALIYYDNSNAATIVNDGTLSDITGNHLYRVDVVDPMAPIDDTGAGVLINVFQTLPGAPAVLPPTLVTADLSAFAGTTVRLRFATLIEIDFFRSSLDDVKLTATSTAFTNGDFETGDFTGWTTIDEGSGFQLVYADPYIPAESGRTIPPPPQGTFAAVTDQGGPGRTILYQDIMIPASGLTTLEATVYYENTDGVNVSPPDLSTAISNQQFRVDVMNPLAPVDDVGAGVLVNLFTTTPAEPAQAGPMTVSADVTGFGGQTVRIRFATVYTNNYFHSVVDNVRLVSSTPPTGQLTYDFETGPQGWSLTGLWHAAFKECATALPGHGGVGSLYFGIGATCTFANGMQVAGNATSPLIDVPTTGAGAVLEFNYLIATENGAPFDNGKVQISNDGGMSWIDLDMDSANGGNLIVSGPSSEFGENLWFETTPSINISAYVGQTVMIRFAFDSLDSGINEFEGWHIDDFEIRPIVPDVEALGVVILGGNEALGDTVTAVASFVNIDKIVPTGPFDVVFYMSNDEFFDAGDVVIGSTVGLLGPDSTDSFSAMATLPVQPGPNFLVACAENVATEIDLADNCTALLLDDGFEQNDADTAAFPLDGRRGQLLSELREQPTGPIDTGLIRGPGVAVPGDDDWYRINVLPGEQRLIVDLRFDGSVTDLNLAVFDSSLAFVTGSFGIASREFIDFDLPSSGVHYLMVFTQSGARRNPYDFWWTAVPQLLPAVFDFETGAAGWGLDGLWHVSQDATCAAGLPGHSAISSLYMGIDGICVFDTGNRVFGLATSPPIPIPNGILGASLDLNYALETENGGGFDMATVLVSDDLGFNWTVLDRDAPNGGTLAVMPPAWLPTTYDLSGFVGRTVLIRFAFDSIDNAVNNFQGWHVDDVFVNPFLPPDLTVSSLLLSGNTVAPGGTLDITASITNVGDLDSDATDATLRLSVDPYARNDDPVLPDTVFGGTVPVAILMPAETSVTMLTAQFDAMLAEGRYWVALCVNGDDFEPRNNCLTTGPITVEQPAGPTIVVGEMVFQSGFE